MSHALLQVLRFFLLAAIWLFFVYAARMVWVDVRRQRSESPRQSEVRSPGVDRSVDRLGRAQSAAELELEPLIPPPADPKEQPDGHLENRP